MTSINTQKPLAKTIQCINPATLAAPGGHYSHAVIANGHVFVSGQLQITSSGKKLNQASFDAQARQVLSNVEAALEAAGTGVTQLVQVRVYVTDSVHWPAFNQIYAKWGGRQPTSERGGAGAHVAPWFSD